MRLVALSDTHGLHYHLEDRDIPDGDVLIHAGDCTSMGTMSEVDSFAKWFEGFPHKLKILVPGNHDFFFQNHSRHDSFKTTEVLIDRELIHDGIKFYGLPWTPTFYNWAFMLDRNSDKMQKVIDAIPLDTKVLISHGPAYGNLDVVCGSEHLGCETLAMRLEELTELELHIFGHIHEGAGVKDRHWISCNAAICNGYNRVVNKPHIFDI